MKIRVVLFVSLMSGLTWAAIEQGAPEALGERVALAMPPRILPSPHPDVTSAALTTTSPQAATSSLQPAGFWDSWQQWSRPPYELDGASRTAERTEKGRLICPDVERESYKGDTVHYHKPVSIYPAFKPTLQRFEEIVVEVANEVYGRPPDRIIHYGTYNCRTIRHRKHRLSEHAFANAIDIAGFEFRALPAKKRKELGLSGRVTKSFKVDVEKHWNSEKGFGAEHARFMKTLVWRLYEEDTFRGMIVPPAPGHKNHLHLDMGRWSYLRGDPRLPEPELPEEVEGS